MLVAYSYLKGGKAALEALKRVGIKVDEHEFGEKDLEMARDLVENNPKEACRIVYNSLQKQEIRSLASVCALSLEVKGYKINGPVDRSELESLLRPWSNLYLSPAFKSLTVIPLNHKWSSLYVPPYTKLLADMFDLKMLKLIPDDLSTTFLKKSCDEKWIISIADLAVWGPGPWLEHPKSKERLLFEVLLGKDLKKLADRVHIEGVLDGLIVNQAIVEDLREIVSEIKLRDSTWIQELVEDLLPGLSFRVERGTLVGETADFDLAIIPWAGHIPPRGQSSSRVVIIGGLPKEKNIRRIIPLIKKSEHYLEPWDSTRGDLLIFLSRNQVILISMYSSQILMKFRDFFRGKGYNTEYFTLYSDR